MRYLQEIDAKYDGNEETTDFNKQNKDNDVSIFFIKVRFDGPFNMIIVYN